MNNQQINKSPSQCGLDLLQSGEVLLHPHHGCSHQPPSKNQLSIPFGKSQVRSEKLSPLLEKIRSESIVNPLINVIRISCSTCSRTIHLMQGRQPICAAAWIGAIPSWARAYRSPPDSFTRYLSTSRCPSWAARYTGVTAFSIPALALENGKELFTSKGGSVDSAIGVGINLNAAAKNQNFRSR